MLEFGEKLTLIPSSLSDHDIHELRVHSFSDPEILSIVLAVAYRNYIVRVADALGVELKPSGKYAPELIRAFGLDARQARKTLYPDRQTRHITNDEGVVTAAPKLDTEPVTGRSPDGSCWIDTIVPSDAGQVFEKARDQLMRLSAQSPMEHFSQALALRPDALAVTTEHMGMLGFGTSEIGTELESLIGLTVSSALSCRYMAVHHCEVLLENGMAGADIRSLSDQGLISEPQKALSDPRACAVVHFSMQLTQRPWTMARSNLDLLRKVQLSDREILTVVAKASLENFLSRLVAGLGVQLEPRLAESPAWDLFRPSVSR